MGRKTPRPESEEPTSLIFTDIWLNEPEGSPLPNPADCTINLELVGPELWTGQTGWAMGDRFAQLQRDGADWGIGLFTVGLVVLAFYAANENWHEIFENQLDETHVYSGGTCEVIFKGADVNQAAADAGMPLGDKVFYEPMPKAVGHKSYRFAYQPNGSRIYIRKEL